MNIKPLFWATSLVVFFFTFCAFSQIDLKLLNPNLDEIMVGDTLYKFSFSVGTSHREVITGLGGGGSPAAERFATRIPGSSSAFEGLGAGPGLFPAEYAEGSIVCLEVIFEEEPEEPEEPDDEFDPDDPQNPDPEPDDQGPPEMEPFDSRDYPVLVELDGKFCLLEASGGQVSGDGRTVSYTQSGQSVEVIEPPTFSPNLGGSSLGEIKTDEFSKEIAFEFGPFNYFLKQFGWESERVNIYLMGRFSQTSFEEDIFAQTFSQSFALQPQIVVDTYGVTPDRLLNGEDISRTVGGGNRVVISEYNQLVQDTDFEAYVFTLGPSIHIDPNWINGLFFSFELYTGVALADAEARTTDVLFREVNGRQSEVGRVELESDDSDWSMVFGFNIHMRYQYAAWFLGIYTGLEYMDDLSVDVGSFTSEFSQDAWRNGVYIGYRI